jgi:hypothetical protein
MLALLVACTTACSSAATVERRGAPDLEARIVGNDDRYLYVENDQGRVFRVERRTVVDIDHPGNVAAAIGTPFLAVSGLLLGLLMTYAPHERWFRGDNLIASVPLVIYGSIGLPLVVGGLGVWLPSAAAAGPSGRLAAPLPVRKAVPDLAPEVMQPPPSIPVPEPVQPPAPMPPAEPVQQPEPGES